MKRNKKVNQKNGSFHDVLKTGITFSESQLQHAEKNLSPLVSDFLPKSQRRKTYFSLEQKKPELLFELLFVLKAGLEHIYFILFNSSQKINKYAISTINKGFQKE